VIARVLAVRPCIWMMCCFHAGRDGGRVRLGADRIPLPTINRSTSAGCAPSATRNPISGTRSTTE
jgi:hypothetical protein